MEAKIITIKHTLQFRVARHTPSAADLVKIAKNLVKSCLHCPIKLSLGCNNIVTTW